MRAGLFVISVILILGARCESGTGSNREPTYTVRGVLTDDGIDCPTVRDRNGVLYSLTGSTGDFKTGDRVCIKGRRLDGSACHQGIALLVDWIGRSRECS
jgi:hypothetical protein